MKKVFSSNWEVMHVFASRTQNEGRTGNGNVFFEGNKIYSYGYHYLLGEFLKDGSIIINDSGYSVSTGKHISYLRNATGHLRQYLSTEVLIDQVHPIVIDLYRKYLRARKPVIYQQQIVYKWHALNTFLEEQKIKGVKGKKLYNELKRIFNTVQSEELTKEAKEIDKKLTAAKKKKEAEKLREFAQDFYNYGSKWLRTEKALVRISKDGKTVETSQGANVPIKEAKTLYKMILAGKDIRGYRIGYYTVISINGTLKIGCHKIDIKSMHRTGKQLLKIEC